MTRIKYVGGCAAVSLPALGLRVENGEVIEVPDDLARSLMEQPTNWQAAPAVKEKS